MGAEDGGQKSVDERCGCRLGPTRARFLMGIGSTGRRVSGTVTTGRLDGDYRRDIELLCDGVLPADGAPQSLPADGAPQRLAEWCGYTPMNPHRSFQKGFDAVMRTDA